MAIVTPASHRDHVIGGKAKALLSAGEAGLPVPAWFAVPPGEAPPADELASALDMLGGNRFAVRSSAVSEDGVAHSFAGQFESFLGVPAGEVATRLLDVRASAQSDHLAAYRREHDLPDPGEPAVLVQRMIDAVCAGVAFSADPVGGQRDRCIVAAIPGTAERLVAGEVEGESWTIGTDGALLFAPADPILQPDQARAVAALARRCAHHFVRPQDIEWAIDREGRIWLLQSRPITTLARRPDPGDDLCIWDNSNIAESYTGVTTPLTFSFARNAYEHVYRRFCRLLRVPAARIERASQVFPRMLGLIRGRVYYNLVNWYRVLALLPGFNLNRRFMEQMMGVKEPMPEVVVARIVRENRVGRLSDALSLARTLLALLVAQIGLKRDIARFHRRLHVALAEPDRPLSEQRGEELVAHYRHLEEQLLHRWDAPLVSDFFAMIYHGVLRGLSAKWLGDESRASPLLLDAGDIVSAEPPRLIAKMAALAAEQDGLPATLQDPRLAVRAKLHAIESCPPILERYESYLARFGDRCLEELKLESPTLADDPGPLLVTIGTMASAPPRTPGTASRESPPRLPNPVKSFLFRFVLRQARRRVRDRENLRFERTRVFGRVRRIVRELGRRLAADDQLDDPADVFYLELDEVLGAYEHTNASAALRTLAAGRKEEFQSYRQSEAPPDRFETRGPLHRHRSFEATHPPVDPGGDERTGAGASPGVVRGRVRVVREPREANLAPGEILVAQQTDPGWVVLFPVAAGLLVERGSLLSHSAIVSRELGLPCVVGLRDLTAWLRTGDLVELDGSTGAVRKLHDEH